MGGRECDVRIINYMKVAPTLLLVLLTLLLFTVRWPVLCGSCRAGQGRTGQVQGQVYGARGADYLTPVMLRSQGL